MLSLIRDLHHHQAWADALHWRAIAAHPAAREDEAIRKRLLHIHTVQRFFLWLPGDQTPMFAAPDAAIAADFEQFKQLARAHHEEALAFLDSVTEAQLSRIIHNPLGPPGGEPLPLSATLTQVAMHSQYHRGQNATRLRELGAEPPLTDLIAWYFFGRPAAQWD